MKFNTTVRITLLIAFFLVIVFVPEHVNGQHTISGRVLNAQDSLPIPYAVLTLQNGEIWAMTDEGGNFTLKNVAEGRNQLKVGLLGYADHTQELAVHASFQHLVIYLKEQNLKLNEVLVTARQKDEQLSTSFNLDRTVLDHMQMLSVTDVTSLLPGGKTTRTPHLATSSGQQFAINGGTNEMGNALFGVAVESDGVRLSNNAMPLANPGGVDTRNITSSNIESIEVVTGIPSVVYGDLSNGLVRIKTQKGATPFVLDLVTKPNTKQIALGKGWSLGPNAGVMNVNLEHTRSVSDLASPYTSYARNGLSIQYHNTFGNKGNHPLEFNAGLTGNWGGYDRRSDPDLFVNTYSREKDNAFRANMSFRWFLSKPWITNIEFQGNVNYNDRLEEVQTNKSTSSSVVAIHTQEEGYFVGQPYDAHPDANVILIPPGYWYEKRFTDNKLLNYAFRLKAHWAKRMGRVDNKLLIGAEYTSNGNLGRGVYYDDLRYAPTWREYRYDEIPFQYNYSVYLEDNLRAPLVGQSSLELMAGARGDLTSIRNSVYSTNWNISPRFNAQLTFLDKPNQHLSLKAGWGKSVKLPSFGVLFPQPNFLDILTFAPGTTAEGTTFYAYYTQPNFPIYNPDLRWQSTYQQEIGVNARFKGFKIFVVASQITTENPYHSLRNYRPFTYKFTDQSHLENSPIPIQNRSYQIDSQTGIVTVSDRTGTLPAHTLDYREYTRFISNSMPFNGSTPIRKRLQWIVDFPSIRSLRTRFRLDGNYYYYKGIEETPVADMPVSNTMMADGNPYKFIGFYIGSSSWSNGSVTKNVNLNLTSTTHIPAVRLIFSARVEGTLYTFQQNLSEYSQGSRGFVLDNRDDYFPSESQNDIYAGDQFIGVYPDYYVSLDDLNTKIPFAEKFRWARTNDPFLYNELAKLVTRTNYNYSFNANRTSAYFSMNIGITKEIGRLATITFNATNFISNMRTVKSDATQQTTTLFNSSYIPALYYGLSLRLKWK